MAHFRHPSAQDWRGDDGAEDGHQHKHREHIWRNHSEVMPHIEDDQFHDARVVFPFAILCSSFVSGLKAPGSAKRLEHANDDPRHGRQGNQRKYRRRDQNLRHDLWTGHPRDLFSASGPSCCHGCAMGGAGFWREVGDRWQVVAAEAIVGKGVEEACTPGAGISARAIQESLKLSSSNPRIQLLMKYLLIFVEEQNYPFQRVVAT